MNEVAYQVFKSKTLLRDANSIKTNLINWFLVRMKRVFVLKFIVILTKSIQIFLSTKFIIGKSVADISCKNIEFYVERVFYFFNLIDIIGKCNSSL